MDDLAWNLMLLKAELIKMEDEGRLSEEDHLLIIELLGNVMNAKTY